MLGLFSPRSTHPLAESREAKRVLGELPAQDPAAAIDAASAWLESLPITGDISPERRLELTLQIDETLLPQTRRLCRDYLTARRVIRAQEYRQWQQSRRYWGELAVAYEDVMARFLEGEKGSEAIKPHLPLVCARLLHAYGGRMKWDHFRYGPVDAAVWAASGAAYLAAQQRSVQVKPVRLYGSGSETTVEAEFLRLLIMDSSSMDKLLPVEIELAERIISHLLPLFTLTDQVRPENVYWVDLQKAIRPTRLARLPEITRSLRFFSTQSALVALAELRHRIEHSGDLPADVNFGGQYSVQAVLPVIAHLAACWAPRPLMREQVRRAVKSRMTVINGLPAIHRRLSGQASGDGSHGEAWVVEDVSQSGIGARLPLVGQDWLRVGCLIGMQPEGGSNWLIGIVRRFARETEAQGTVGIQTLSKLPVAYIGDCGGLRTEVVVLDPLVIGTDARAVLPEAAWDEHAPVLIVRPVGGYRLRPLALEDRSDDFAVGRFRVDALR